MNHMKRSRRYVYSCKIKIMDPRSRLDTITVMSANVSTSGLALDVAHEACQKFVKTISKGTDVNIEFFLGEKMILATGTIARIDKKGNIVGVLFNSFLKGDKKVIEDFFKAAN